MPSIGVSPNGLDPFECTKCPHDNVILSNPAMNHRRASDQPLSPADTSAGPAPAAPPRASVRKTTFYRSAIARSISTAHGPGEARLGTDYRISRVAFRRCRRAVLAVQHMHTGGVGRTASSRALSDSTAGAPATATGRGASSTPRRLSCRLKREAQWERRNRRFRVSWLRRSEKPEKGGDELEPIAPFSALSAQSLRNGDDAGTPRRARGRAARTGRPRSVGSWARRRCTRRLAAHRSPIRHR
jgi:hypothetical protein